MGHYVIGISGASGAVYAQRTLEGALAASQEVTCVISETARRVMKLELGLHLTGSVEIDEGLLRQNLSVSDASGLTLIDYRDVGASIASGSYPIDGMVVVPCSTGTLGRIANGISSSLIERAADVTLKERRRLVLVPRETPLSNIHLRNMLALTEAGAVVLPASPGFYHGPTSVRDLVDVIAGRILDQLGIETSLVKRWLGEPHVENKTSKNGGDPDAL